MSYFIGAAVSWNQLAGLALAFSLAGGFLALFLVESPVWLLNRGRTDAARAALGRLRRGGEEELDEQMRDVQATVTHQAQESNAGIAGLRQLLGDATSRRALHIGVGLMVVQQLSGINAVVFYTGEVFQSLQLSVTASDNLSTGVEAMELVVTLAALLLMDRIGRLRLLLFAAVGQCLSLVILGSSFVASNIPQGVGVVGVYLYMFFFASGMGAVPWTMLGEIFQPRVKGIAGSAVVATNWLLAFVVTYTMDDLSGAFQSAFSADFISKNQNAGLGALFFLYSGICLLGVVWMVMFVIETKGKTFSQIQDELANNRLCRRRATAPQVSEVPTLRRGSATTQEMAPASVEWEGKPQQSETQKVARDQVSSAPLDVLQCAGTQHRVTSTV